MERIRQAAAEPVEVNPPAHVDRCTVCGIPIISSAWTMWRHAEPRTLENNLHNGTPDHNAVGPRYF